MVGNLFEDQDTLFCVTYHNLDLFMSTALLICCHLWVHHIVVFLLVANFHTINDLDGQMLLIMNFDTKWTGLVAVHFISSLLKIRNYVRLFLSEDSPSQIGLGAQDHLQAKASWLLHSLGTSLDDQLPPGFEGAHSANKLKNEVSQIPLVKWQRPAKLLLNPLWQVVAGEESKEVEVQTQRELRVLEAIYPHSSAIPLSASVSSDVEACHFDDNQTPVVPMTAIEDEEANDPPPNLVVENNIATTSQLPMLPPSFLANVNHLTSQGSMPVGLRPPTSDKPPTVPGVEPDVVLAASAAFTAIMRSNEQGSMIDPELLVKILSSPKLIEKLVSDYGPTNQLTSKPISLPMSLSAPQSGTPPLHHVSRIEPEPPMPSTTTVHFHPATSPMTAPSAVHQMPMPAPAVRAPAVKDVSYYKSLIQMHGEERQEAHDNVIPQFANNRQQAGIKAEQMQNSKSRDFKPKIKKPCIYFNSSRGCKHGANCAFQHDSSSQQRMGGGPELQNAKRMKLDREITGRT
ncbi:hypothetical protein Scep_000429 [Stephania cephalantha]|uniref:C3H1-type domain-containing protein n=1 Tax=Stephania cephalantha TaxID=152367 RepID=A0AAP0L657_9MAGN